MDIDSIEIDGSRDQRLGILEEDTDTQRVDGSTDIDIPIDGIGDIIIPTNINGLKELWLHTDGLPDGLIVGELNTLLFGENGILDHYTIEELTESNGLDGEPTG